MPSVSTKRKQSLTQPSKLSPGGVAKRPRIEPSEEVGESSSFWTAGTDDIVNLKEKLDEITKRYLELEKEARINVEIIQKVHERLQCSICRDTMRNPYILDCGHSACLKCLRRCFILARQLDWYPLYDDGMVSTDDDSDNGGEEKGGLSFPPILSVSRSQSLSELPRRHRFRSMIYCKKECPVCKATIRRRPVIDYTLRHVIDELRPTPLSPTALMDRDLRWGRRRDVWRGIFLADPFADNYQQEEQEEQEEREEQAPIPLSGRNESPSPVPLLPAPSFTFEERLVELRRRWLSADITDADAEDMNANIPRRRRRRLPRGIYPYPYIGGSIPSTTSGPIVNQSLAPSTPAPLPRTSSQTDTLIPSRESSPTPDFEVRSRPRPVWNETPEPPPQLDFLEGIDIFTVSEEGIEGPVEVDFANDSEADVKSLRASPSPSPSPVPVPSHSEQCSHSNVFNSVSSSVPNSSRSRSLRSVEEIVESLFGSRSSSVDPSSDAVDDEAAIKEREQTRGTDVKKLELQNKEEKDEDVDFSLTHAMLHVNGESSGSGSLEYPVYAGQLELPVWLRTE